MFAPAIIYLLDRKTFGKYRYAFVKNAFYFSSATAPSYTIPAGSCFPPTYIDTINAYGVGNLKMNIYSGGTDQLSNEDYYIIKLGFK